MSERRTHKAGDSQGANELMDLTSSMKTKCSDRMMALSLQHYFFQLLVPDFAEVQVEPREGSIEGGQILTIHGTNLLDVHHRMEGGETAHDASGLQAPLRTRPLFGEGHLSTCASEKSFGLLFPQLGSRVHMNAYRNSTSLFFFLCHG